MSYICLITNNSHPKPLLRCGLHKSTKTMPMPIVNGIAYYLGVLFRRVRISYTNLKLPRLVYNNHKSTYIYLGR